MPNPVENIQSAMTSLSLIAEPASPTHDYHASPKLKYPDKPVAQQGFTALDFYNLAQNEHYRYAHSSNRVAHAVIFNNMNGEKQAWQFSLPCDNKRSPTVVGLHQFEAINRFGLTRYRAKGPDGKTWYAKRSTHAQITLDNKLKDTEADIAYFSEAEDGDEEPFWESMSRIPRFCNKEASRTGHLTKGGYEMPVDYESVKYRSENRKRSPNQNQVMGGSARDAYESYFKMMENDLSPAMKGVLERSFSADIHTSPENQYRPEWLHAYAHSLMPKSDNPQQKNNLGAAPKWANTEMMVLERIAQWFTVTRDSSTKVSINSLFEMLGDSDLVNIVKFEVSVEFKERFIRFKQELDAFKAYPVFRKASDLAQAAGVSYALLHGESAASSAIVHQEKKIKAKRKNSKRYFFPESDSDDEASHLSDADAPKTAEKDPPHFFTPSFFIPPQPENRKKRIDQAEESQSANQPEW